MDWWFAVAAAAVVAAVVAAAVEGTPRDCFEGKSVVAECNHQIPPPSASAGVAEELAVAVAVQMDSGRPGRKSPQTPRAERNPSAEAVAVESRFAAGRTPLAGVAVESPSAETAVPAVAAGIVVAVASAALPYAVGLAVQWNQRSQSDPSGCPSWSNWDQRFVVAQAQARDWDC